LLFRYNSRDHPLPFIKASSVVAPKKQSRDKPDLEEAIEESDEGEVLEDPDEKTGEPEEDDLKKDKYIKQGGTKKAAAKRGKAKGKADADDEVEEKPKKAKGKGKAKK